jgi:predicted SAM-dependent methyltransferase
MIKLNLGCGSEYLDGYINCDMYAEKVDKRFDAAKIDMNDNTVDEIRAYHLIEHFDFKQIFSVFSEWNRVLKSSGSLILETPDLFSTCKRFVEADENEKLFLYGHMFSMPWIDGLTHKFLFTESQIVWTLQQCSFKDIKRVDPDSIYAKNNPTKQDLFMKIIAIKA